MTYRVRLAMLGREWDIEQGDPAMVDDLPIVMDGMSLAWSYGNPSVYPEQPQPVTLAFQLLYERSALATDLVIGAAVDLEVFTDAYPGYLPDVPATASFTGRVGAVSAAPDELGILYTVVATDVTAQLGEHLVGDTPWPAEGLQSRINRVAAAAGIVGDLATDTDTTGGSPVAARDVDAQNALELLTGYLRQWPFSSLVYRQPHRQVLTGHVSEPGDAYELVPVPDHIIQGRYPGRLNSDGVLHFVREGPSGGLGCWVLDAAWVDFAAVWQQTKGANPNTVVVAGDAGTAIATTGETPTVAASLTGVELTDLDDMALLAQMYLPGTTQQSAWTVDTFTLLGLEGMDLGAGMLLLSSRDDAFDAQLTLTGVVVIDGIPAEQTPVFQYPNGTAFYAGLLNGATLTIMDGEWSIGFQVRPDVPRPPPEGDGFAVTWADLAADVPGLTWAEMDPVFTWADARLIGREG